MTPHFLRKVAADSNKKSNNSISKSLSRSIYMALPNSPSELGIPIVGAGMAYGAMVANDKLVRPKVNDLNAAAHKLEKDKFIALANRHTKQNNDFVKNLDERITTHNKKVVNTLRLNKALNLAGYAGLGITFAGVPVYHYLKKKLKQRTKTAASVHEKSGISDTDFNRYNTLMYRSDLASKGATALATTAVGSRLLGKNVKLINNITTKKLSQPVLSSSIAKKALRISKGTRLGAIGTGIGALALTSSAMKLDPEYHNANAVERSTGMLFNPDSTLERYHKAYNRPLSSTTAVTLNI